jgi:lipopolysaccharide biosynthesis glycosyltransferase
MEVACATDDRYAPHCGTMLLSLLDHNKPSQIRIHLLHDETLGSVNKNRLVSMVEAAGSELHLVHVPANLVQGFPTKRFHASCWYRIVLPSLVPALKRVLYLDADMLILDSLQPLWQAPLDDNAFGAVSNPLYPFMPDRPCVELGLSSRGDYLNSGVLLLDLESMRREDIPGRVLTYAQAHPDNPWPEQDALSVVCNGRWKRLHPRWNVQTTFFDLRDEYLLYPAQESQAARQTPAIVHFIGPLKPWHYLCRHPLRQMYAQYRSQTQWPDFELEGRTWLNRVLRPLSLGSQVRIKGTMQKLTNLASRVF